MPCYHPLPAWRSKYRTATGWPITFKFSDAFKDKPVEVPCGRCIGCRLQKANDWTTRLMHEAQLHEDSCFCTLTYDDAHLPPNASLRPLDVTLFLKRLRKSLAPRVVRFFQVGEYGDTTHRPHHHLLLFGHTFTDRHLLRSEPDRLYESPTLTKLWGHGMCSFGDVTRQSANYCARYTTKRITGERAEEHYRGRVPEYATMSRRPGIGADWLKRYEREVYPAGTITLNGGAIMRAPLYYDNRYKLTDPDAWAAITTKRTRARKNDPNATGKRLITREQVTLGRLGLKRTRSL